MAEFGKTFWPALRSENGHEHGYDLGCCAAKHIFWEGEGGNDGLLDIFERFGRDEIVVKEDMVFEDETGYGAGCEVFGCEGGEGEDAVIGVVRDLAHRIETLSREHVRKEG